MSLPVHRVRRGEPGRCLALSLKSRATLCIISQLMVEGEIRATTEHLRIAFIERHIRPYVENPLLVEAFACVDRGVFSPHSDELLVYSNRIIALAEGSSLTEPTLLAKMIDLLNLTREERVLEVGTGSGYTAAVLSRCAREVHTVEFNEELCVSAAQRLARLGYNNVCVHTGDGARGIPVHSPYDAIIVTAAVREVPQALFEQLAEGGRIVAPTGDEPSGQRIVLGTKHGNSLHTRFFYKVSFHPLKSDEHGGWSSQATDRKRSYKFIVDDSEPEELKLKQVPVGREGIISKSSSDENIKLTEEAQGLLVQFGVTFDQFIAVLSGLGMERQKAQVLLTSHPEALNQILSMLRGIGKV